MSRVELFRALFDVNVNLPGAGRGRNQKTGERFVLDKEFAADERVRGGERPSIAVSCIDDYVRNDALEEARIDLIGWVSGIVTLAERVFACPAVSTFDRHPRFLDLLDQTPDN